MPPVTVADVVAVLDVLAPPRFALPDDPIGLLVGDPAAPVTQVVVALDATLAVAREAAASGAGLIVAHHPLVYHPLRAVRADDPIGAVVLFCAQNGIAVAAAHTNWDVAPGGVNDVLAERIGLTETHPLQITFRESLAKVTVFVPREHREAVLDAMAAAGAGAIGNYDRCAFMAAGVGTFRPLPDAQPFVGTVGEPETTPEERLEMITPADKTDAVVAAMRAAHPYEEVAFDVYPLANTTGAQGIGRIGTLAREMTAPRFLESVRDALDFEPVRMVGPTDRVVRTVAVCGGAGAFLMHDALAQNADAFVTADVRHHELVEAMARGLLLLDAGHAATETPGTEALARLLADRLADRNASVRFLLPDGHEPG